MELRQTVVMPHGSHRDTCAKRARKNGGTLRAQCYLRNEASYPLAAPATASLNTLAAAVTQMDAAAICLQLYFNDHYPADVKQRLADRNSRTQSAVLPTPEIGASHGAFCVRRRKLT